MGKFQRSRRIGTAAIIAALHIVALSLLFALRPQSVPAPETERPPVTVVILPREESPGPAPADNPVFTPPLAITAPFPMPALPAPPAITSPLADPALAALGQYLGCRLPAEQQRTEDKERCAEIMRNLPVGSPQAIPQTEEEKALARKFDHDQKALNAPMAVPCLMGAMISPVCVAATLLTGGDFITTYADVPEHKHEPLATGMVGRNGKPPGYP